MGIYMRVYVPNATVQDGKSVQYSRPGRKEGLRYRYPRATRSVACRDIVKHACNIRTVGQPVNVL